jgi:cleavage and polyadenylation specificity factor subunit 4
MVSLSLARQQPQTSVCPPTRLTSLHALYSLSMADTATSDLQILSLGPSPADLARQILSHQAPKYTFSFTPFLRDTYRHGISPNRPTCKAYLQGHCPQGPSCPDKHPVNNTPSNYNNLVCKHWLRGLCKKGESCEFLHEFNLRQMPECAMWARNGYCSNGGKSCQYFTW